MALDAAVENLAGYRRPWQQQEEVVPPYAPPQDYAGNGRRKSMRAWTAEDMLLAAGSRACGRSGVPKARHPLCLQSAYAAVTGGEAAYSTCHDK